MIIIKKTTEYEAMEDNGRHIFNIIKKTAEMQAMTDNYTHDY